MDAQTVAKNLAVRAAFDEAVLIGLAEWRTTPGLNGPAELAETIWRELQNRGDTIWVGFAPDCIVDAEIVDGLTPAEAAAAVDTTLEEALETVLRVAGLPSEGYPLAHTMSGRIVPSGDGDLGDLTSDLAEIARRATNNEQPDKAPAATADPEREAPDSIQRRLAETAPDLLGWFRERATPAPAVHTDPNNGHEYCDRCCTYVADADGHVDWHEALTIMMDALAGMIVTSRERSQ